VRIALDPLHVELGGPEIGGSRLGAIQQPARAQPLAEDLVELGGQEHQPAHEVEPAQ
jgi:hypothetical protein